MALKSLDNTKAMNYYLQANHFNPTMWVHIITPCQS